MLADPAHRGAHDERFALDVAELASAARTLHHRLLVATQKSFEKLHGAAVEGPGVLLQLAVHNPLFAWLRPLSQQLALLDELAEADELHDADVARAAAELADVVESDAFRGTFLSICKPSLTSCSRTRRFDLCSRAPGVLEKHRREVRPLEDASAFHANSVKNART